MNHGEQYDEDYFLRGKESGKSLYENYRWMPELTIPMAAHIVCHCDIKKGQTILDFGCARGYTVKALRSLHHTAFGYDVSQWALDNCDPAVKDYLLTRETQLSRNCFDWVIAKDVLEHVEVVSYTIPALMETARRGVFVVVPLAEKAPELYDVQEYEADVTHIHRKPLGWWAGQFMRPGWSVEARYRLPGVKDNYAQYPTGNGFITARRIE